MNAHRLHFLRRFANAINTTVTMAANMSHQTQLHHALTELQETRKAGIAADEAFAEMNIQESPAGLAPVKSAALEELPESIVAILTQPIVWQEQQSSEVTVVEDPITAPIESTLAQEKSVTESLPSATAIHQQKSKIVVDFSQKIATSFFQSLPWQTPLNNVNDSTDNSHNFFQNNQSEIPKIFFDPWNTELATQFFSTVSWTGKSVQRLSISAGDGATEGTIEPAMMTSTIATPYLQPVNQFFSQLPWGGTRLH